MNNIGDVYSEIAKTALMKWNKLSENEASETIQKSSFDELENRVKAKTSIKSALKSIYKILINKNIDVNKNEFNELYNSILHKSKEDAIFYSIKEKIKGNFENSDIIQVLSDIHDGWVETHERKFNARDKKYEHAALELIGWEDTKSDLIFVKPILENFEIEVNENELYKEYFKRTKQFFMNNKILKKGDLERKISEGEEFYPPISNQDKIIKQLKEKPEMVSHIAQQIQEKLGIRRYKVPEYRDSDDEFER